MQAIVIFLLVPLLPRYQVCEAVAQETSIRIASSAARDFRRFWMWAWCCWGGLYIGLAGADESPASSAHFLILLNALQNVTTSLLICCWDVLARRTVRASFARQPLLQPRHWIIVVATLIFAEYAATRLDAFLVATSDEPSPLRTQRFFSWISGFSQGTALVLLVSRLGSPLFGKPSLATGALLFYAVIQGAWPAFSEDAALATAFTWLALVLKCVVFLYIAWALESDVLTYYLVRSRELGDTIETGDRWKFLAACQGGDLRTLRAMLPEGLPQGRTECCGPP